MVSIRRKILDEGQIVQEQLIRVLQSHENRIAALEGNNNDTPATTRDISFSITDGTDPIQGASVVIGSTTKTTGSAGGCSFTGVAEGSVSVEVSKEGYTTKTETITVDSEHTSFTITLVAA